MKTITVIAVLLLCASICLAQTNAETTITTGQTNPAPKNVNRVRIPTYLAESMTRRTVLPRDIGIPGDVVFEMLVEKDGRVLSVRGVSGDSGVIHSAKPAMMKWVFSPFLLDGEPVQFLTELTVQFDGKKGSAKLKPESDPLTTRTPEPE